MGAYIGSTRSCGLYSAPKPARSAGASRLRALRRLYRRARPATMHLAQSRHKAESRVGARHPRHSPAPADGSVVAPTPRSNHARYHHLRVATWGKPAVSHFAVVSKCPRCYTSPERQLNCEVLTFPSDVPCVVMNR